MKRLTTLCSCLLVTLLAVSPGVAQRRDKPGGAAEQGAAPQLEPSASQQLEMCREMMAQMDTGQTRKGLMGAGPGGPGMHVPMMHLMMRQMMGGETDPASIGMTEAMGAGNMDAKTMGRMLQMRGEMLKAIGEIMLKHGKAMEEEK